MRNNHTNIQMRTVNPVLIIVKLGPVNKDQLLNLRQDPIII